MTTTVHDGGPAFSRGGFASPDHQYIDQGDAGMSLRDWLAGQALVGMGTWTPEAHDGPATDFTDLRREAELTRRARWAYAQADAMLKARQP